MNYFEWSKEYYETAAEIANVIEKLKNSRKKCNLSEKNEFDRKIAAYRMYYNECILTANHLIERHKGVA